MVKFIDSDDYIDTIMVRCMCVSHCNIVSFLKVDNYVMIDVHINYYNDKKKLKKLSELEHRFVLFKEEFKKFKSIINLLKNCESKEIDYSNFNVAKCSISAYRYNDIYGIVWYLNNKDFKNNDSALDITLNKQMLDDLSEKLNDWDLSEVNRDK